jgi:pantetheine-phosphate adenylyltransferase
MEKEVETVFLMASPEYAYLSSSVVKEIATYGGSIKGLVPQSIEEEIFNRIFKS